jgi:hypothetical protein
MLYRQAAGGRHYFLKIIGVSSKPNYSHFVIDKLY